MTSERFELRLSSSHVAVENGWLREHGVRVEGWRMPESVLALASGFTSSLQVSAEEKDRALEWAETVWPPECGVPITVHRL